jgi:hypothetical protein
MKEQGFEDKMKQYQLRNMEQLCSCLRVILGQVAISQIISFVTEAAA